VIIASEIIFISKHQGGIGLDVRGFFHIVFHLVEAASVKRLAIELSMSVQK